MITVKEVKTRSEAHKFADYPNHLYRDNKYYIPSLISEDLADWDPKKNPAFEFCRGKRFLAYRDGEIVGRIAAIYNSKANEKFKQARLRFSQVDFIDDEEVSKALFEAVENYARELNCNEIHGPLGFTDLDREGMLVEGFDRRGLFFTYYNYPYYNDHMARLGFVKDVDWIEYMLTVPEGSNTRLEEIANLVLKRNNLHIVPLKNKADIKANLRKVFDLFNEAYAPLYGAFELTEAQLEVYCKKYISVLDPNFVHLVANEKNELVAFGIAAPSIEDAVKKSNGRLFPFGAFRILRALKKSDALNLFLVAVRPDLQGAGVNSILMNQMLKSCLKLGIKRAETGPELETNLKVAAQWRFFNAELHKRRRCYVKSI